MKVRRKMDISIFAARLAELRKNEGLTQYELSKQTGIGKTSIENYEECKTFPSSDVIYTFCTFFKCSSDYLLGLTDKSSLSPTAYECAKMINSMKRVEQEWTIFMVEAIKNRLEAIRNTHRIHTQDFIRKLLNDE